MKFLLKIFFIINLILNFSSCANIKDRKDRQAEKEEKKITELKKKIRD